MTLSATLTLTDRFSLILGNLCRAVAARVVGGAMAEAMILQVWRRIRRAEREVLGLLARFRAGRLWVVTRGPVARSGGGGRVGVAPDLPRAFAWLIPLVPQWAAGYASQLRVVLAEPEMVALMAATPQARRALRPLCRMLGIEPALLAPPPGTGSQPEPVASVPETRVVPEQVDWDSGVRIDGLGEQPGGTHRAWRGPPDG